MAKLYGYLHSHNQGISGGENAAEQTQSQIDNALQLDPHFSSRTKSKPQPLAHSTWQPFLYASEHPLRGELPDMIGGPYHYPFYVYLNRHTGNVILASLSYSITNSVVSTINNRMTRNLVRNSIDVDRITKAMVGRRLSNEEKKFFITHLKVDVNSDGDKIETLSLDGTDLLGSDFFSGYLQFEYVAKDVGLKLSGETYESAKLQRHGGIQFWENKFKEVEVCLGFVTSINAFIRTA